MITQKLFVGTVLTLGCLGVAGSSSAQCRPVGDIQFICDLIGPEDLARVPGTNWVIASGNQEGGRLHAVHIQNKITAVLFPTITRVERHDRTRYPTCPGPLDLAEPDRFRAHGLYLKSGSNETHSLYVVHHGSRESIEIFDVNGGVDPPALTWVGCAVAPEALRLNSVVALPQGGLATTSPGTGDVWRWHPDSGWTQIPGSDDTAPNGLEVSANGQWLYIAGWREEKLTRLSLGKTPVEKTTVDIGFRPDNLRWSPDGSTIYAAGHGNYRTPQETSNVATIAPSSLEVTRIFQHTRIDGFEASTTAIRVGDEMWLGTNRGRMIAYFPMPNADQ